MELGKKICLPATIGRESGWIYGWSEWEDDNGYLIEIDNGY
jgi:hypothetical protein